MGVKPMPIEPHRRRLGPNWNEGARRLWLVMIERGLNQSDVRRGLKGPSGNELTEGAVNRWLYGERRPSGRLLTQIEDVFGVPAGAWFQTAVGKIPSRAAKPSSGAAA
jgi:transcriptional regulator with XRE-family HTH domain